MTDAYIKQALFHAILANDLSTRRAAELAAVQRPIAASALGEPSGPPAWQRAHARTTEVHASHLSLISQPRIVTSVIESAAHHVG